MTEAMGDPGLRRGIGSPMLVAADQRRPTVRQRWPFGRPDASNAAILQEAATSIRVPSGTQVVGQTMEPGTYQTNPASNCYWSRTTGAILAIDFVGFAPNGVAVTFTRERVSNSKVAASGPKIG